jgi:hypothetical protein
MYVCVAPPHTYIVNISIYVLHLRTHTSLIGLCMCGISVHIHRLYIYICVASPHTYIVNMSMYVRHLHTSIVNGADLNVFVLSLTSYF